MLILINHWNVAHRLVAMFLPKHRTVFSQNVIINEYAVQRSLANK